MGKWLIRKPEPTHVQGLCVTCGVHPQRNKGTSNRPRYAAQCGICLFKRHPRTMTTTQQRRRHKMGVHSEDVKCATCGFVPEHPCQIDVDHKDGNHKNDAPENLQLLCANCHRLKTFRNQDWKSHSLLM